MTTQDKVLKMSIAAGFDSCIEYNDIEHLGVFSDTGFKEGFFMSLTEQINKLIELAMTEERQAILKLIKSVLIVQDCSEHTMGLNSMQRRIYDLIELRINHDN